MCTGQNIIYIEQKGKAVNRNRVSKNMRVIDFKNNFRQVKDCHIYILNQPTSYELIKIAIEINEINCQFWTL